jgi:hypothetical protein
MSKWMEYKISSKIHVQIQDRNLPRRALHGKTSEFILKLVENHCRILRPEYNDQKTKVL